MLKLTKEYTKVVNKKEVFIPGKSYIHYAGRVYNEEEVVNLVSSSLDFWLTAGKHADALENKFTKYFDSEGFVLVNSGSSANLLMISALCSEAAKDVVGGPGRLMSGDEIITPAVTFPTTLAPIIQNNLIPVFVDCKAVTYNINPELIEEAIGPRTKAIFIPHTIGIPCDMEIIKSIATDHNLWLLEDNCDSLGATFNDQLVGTFGDMSSHSFFPAHHMTMGEGGGVNINNEGFKKIVCSLRDWGRDCSCGPGQNNNCGKRFSMDMGTLPHGYDHKYIYSNIGYNLKLTDMQAAIGLAQFKKLDYFIRARRKNFWELYNRLKPYSDSICLPTIDSRMNPSPFSFPITVKNGISRLDFINHLEKAKIETRLMFGGNVLRQPGYMNIERRVPGPLDVSDEIMNNSFFVGVYPGIDKVRLNYMAEQIIGFLK